MPKSVPLVCVVDVDICCVQVDTGIMHIYIIMYVHALCVHIHILCGSCIHACVCFCAYVGLCFLFSIFLFSIPMSYIEVAVSID